MKKLEDHPLAELFPLLEEQELAELTASIRENGFIGAITLLDGKILDGRNRYRAAISAGVEPICREHKKGDPLAFVIMANLTRRHLTASQRAMVAARLSTAKTGRPGNSANLRTLPSVTTSKAAETLNVSTRSVEAAKEVIRDAPKAVVRAVDAGTKTVAAARKEIAAKDDKTNGDVIRDETGYPIPKKALVFWLRKQEIQDLLTHISKARSALRNVKVDDDPMFVETNMGGCIADLNQAYNRLQTSLPHAVCPNCQGQTPDHCQLCKGRGLVSKFLWDTAIPEELKAIRQKACK